MDCWRLSVHGLLEIVGKDVYNLAVKHYWSSNYHSVLEPDYLEPDAQLDRLNKLVLAIQRPLVFYAYERYSAYSDLETSNAGRKMIVTENRKNAFEWMIDNYDFGLIRDANQTTDYLIEFLESEATPFGFWTLGKTFSSGEIIERNNLFYICVTEHVSANFDDDLAAVRWLEKPITEIVFPEWTMSLQCKLLREMFIRNANEFHDFCPIDRSRRFFMQLIPFLKRAEQQHILPRLGTARYVELKHELKYNQLNQSSQELLQYIRAVIAPLAVSEAIQKFSLKVFPDSVVQLFKSERQTTNASLPADAILRERIYEMYRKEAQEAIAALEKAVKTITIFPEGGIRQKIADQYKTKKFIRL